MNTVENLENIPSTLNICWGYIPEKCNLHSINGLREFFPVTISYMVFYNAIGTASVEHIIHHGTYNQLE